MLKKTLRISLGILLILTTLPPLSLHVGNIFTAMPAGIGVILIFWPVIIKFLKKHTGKYYKKIMITASVLVSVIFIFLLTEFVLLFQNSFPQQPPEDAVVIVLGSKAEGNNPTIILDGRIRAAANYLISHPRAKCIATGGKGADETESEARCIRDVLVDRYSIDSSRIYMDEASSNTRQNFENAVNIIEINRLSRHAAVVTDGFHMLRAKLIAGRQGLQPFACPAATDWRLAPTFYIRELFALPKTVLFDQ